MTVKEFKKIIAELPDHTNDWEVVMSKDAEGNGFNKLSNNGISFDDDDICTQYFDENERDLFSHNEENYECFEEFLEIVMSDSNLKPCIVLWP
jgi:hypothetical protein